MCCKTILELDIKRGVVANSSDRNTEAHPFKRPSPEQSSSAEGPPAHLSIESSPTSQSSPEESPADEVPPAHLSYDQSGPDYPPDFSSDYSSDSSPDSGTNFT